jgi:hypothetical protein
MAKKTKVATRSHVSSKTSAAQYAMRIQARPGSPVERDLYFNSDLPGRAWPSPQEIAKGINPSPLDDLIFHGGTTVPQMGFRNIYLGSQSNWSSSDITFIDSAIKRAMQDLRLNAIMRLCHAMRYPRSCSPMPSPRNSTSRPSRPRS